MARFSGLAKRLHDERIARESEARFDTAEQLDRLFGDGWLDEPKRTEPYPRAPGYELKVESFINNDRAVAYRSTVWHAARCVFFGREQSSPIAARYEGVAHLNQVAYLAHVNGGAK